MDRNRRGDERQTQNPIPTPQSCNLRIHAWNPRHTLRARRTECRCICFPAARLLGLAYFFEGSCSICLSFCSNIIFSCVLVSLGNRNEICNFMLQGELPGGWI